MLTQRLTPALRAALPEPGTWRWWPAAGDRAAWEAALTPERREWILAKATADRAAGWPALPATLYLDCKRTDNRERFEKVFFARRAQMAHFTLAYVATRDPAWLDAALDALWSIAEESSWSLPAHIGGHPTKGRHGLPQHDVIVVDLFSAETGAVVADALDILRDDLAAIDASIVPRLIHELRTRIIDPVTGDTAWWWLSGGNNWSPWIVANAGRVVLAHARDRVGMELVVERYLGVLDRFLGNYGADGGCDEGIRYWGVAFGTTFLFLEALHQASAGRIDLFDHPQFRALGTFPVNAHLGGKYFLPFGDNIGTGSVRRSLGWRIGERLGLPTLQEIAWQEARRFDPLAAPEPMLVGGNGSALQDELWQLFWPIADQRPAVPPPASRTWLPELQVLVARTPGLTMAVKGGHNGENHNHNDVGQIHVLKAGRPVVIDPGVEVYTAKTFGPERYAIWCIRGSGHNPPVINGHEQQAIPWSRTAQMSAAQAGRAQADGTVQVETAGDVERFAVELARCYPDAAALTRVQRRVEFDRAAQRITVVDEVVADGALTVETTWFTAEDPASGAFTLAFPGSEVATVVWPLDDPLLRKSWSTERLWRITATTRGTGRVVARVEIS